MTCKALAGLSLWSWSLDGLFSSHALACPFLFPPLEHTSDTQTCPLTSLHLPHPSACYASPSFRFELTVTFSGKPSLALLTGMVPCHVY